MSARLVDYYAGTYDQDEVMRRWLKLLGFDVRVDRDHAQIGVSCGAVAGEAVALMLGAYGDWCEVDCGRACSPGLVRYAYGEHLFTEEFTEGRARARDRGAEIAGGDAPRRRTYRLGNPRVSARASLRATPPPGARRSPELAPRHTHSATLTRALSRGAAAGDCESARPRAGSPHEAHAYGPGERGAARGG